MQIALLITLIILAIVAIALQLVLLRRDPKQDDTHITEALDQIAREFHALPTAATFREDAAAMRKEQAEAAKAQREEHAAQAKSHREELSKEFASFSQKVSQDINQLGIHQRDRLKDFADNLAKLTKLNDEKADALRQAVEKKLDQLQQSNEQKLEKMRQTVDEKLHKTFETRLGESFKLVSDRLELVHKGLGEMQELAGGVSDLKRVMSNVKTRGTWGEVLLGSLLEQVLTPEQYEKNCKVRPRSDVQVEYAVKMPGPDDDDGRSHIYLPIDAKFPRESYERIVQASDAADPVALEAAQKQLEASVLSFARDIREKYIAPPYTTDFAILFLPTEGLYAELVRRPGLVDRLQRECRVNLAGPTTLLALLNSLQMGFRTLAIQKRSGEVWKLLGGIKTEFGRFEDWIEAVQKKLSSASKEMDKAAVRTRQINKKLSKVQELPAAEASGSPAPLSLTPTADADDEDETTALFEDEQV
ncbi:MAG: DNA recombination protein RmuC [Phycisphaeraceae bacterium]